MPVGSPGQTAAGDLRSRTTYAPTEAEVSYTHDSKPLDENDWAALSQDLYQGWIAAYGERMQEGGLDHKLKEWTAAREMAIKGAADWPWPGSSNLCLPVIPSQIQSATAYATAGTLVDRLAIVTGLTDEAAKEAFKVETWLNNEIRRQRGSRSWLQEFIKMIDLGYWHGTSIVETPWRKTVQTRLLKTREDVLDPETGMPIIRPDGRKHHRFKQTPVEQIAWNDVDLRTRYLRDVMLNPAESYSIDEAAAVYVQEWPYESDLMQMAKTPENPEGVLDPDEIETALQYVVYGQTDVAWDPKGFYDKTARNRIMPGMGQGTQTSRFFRNRGPLNVQRIHSNQYDLNGDGWPEENIFWLCLDNFRMLGWTEYSYLLEGRPLYAFSPFPRPDRFYGWSLTEWLTDLTSEINTLSNMRNNRISISILPPIVEKIGSEIHSKKRKFYPGARWFTENPATDIQVLPLPQMDLSVFATINELNQWVEKVSGLSNPSIGVQATGGRKTATQSKIESAGTAQRNNLVMIHARHALRTILNGVVTLKRQFMEEPATIGDGPDRFTVTQEMLALPFRIDVAGASDPNDANTRKTEFMALFEIMAKTPEFMQSAVFRYKMETLLFEAWNRIDTQRLLGTEEDAQTRQAQAEKAQAAMAAFKMAQAQRQLGGKGGQNGAAPQPQGAAA
jgi:hypothetical protein